MVDGSDRRWRLAWLLVATWFLAGCSFGTPLPRNQLSLPTVARIEIEGRNKVAQWVSAIAFNPRRAELYVGTGDGKIHIYSTSTWRKLGVLQGHQFWVAAIACSPDGQLLASLDQPSGGENQAGPLTLRTWDVATRRQIAQVALDAYKPDVDQFLCAAAPCIQFSAAGDAVVWSRHRGKRMYVGLYSLATKHHAEAASSCSRFPLIPLDVDNWLAGGHVWHVAYSPDVSIKQGRALRADAFDQTQRLAFIWHRRLEIHWQLLRAVHVCVDAVDAQTGSRLRRWVLLRTPSEPYDLLLQVSPRHRALLVGCARTVEILDVDNDRAPVAVLASPEIRQIALSPDEKYIVIGGEAGVAVWEFPAGR